MPWVGDYRPYWEKGNEEKIHLEKRYFWDFILAVFI